MSRGKKVKGPPFVAVFYETLNSEAFKQLSGTATKVFLLMLAKVKVPLNGSARYNEAFAISYTEIGSWGISRCAASRAIKELVDLGLVEVKAKGGLKGCNGTANKYALSLLYKKGVPLARI